MQTMDIGGKTVDFSSVDTLIATYSDLRKAPSLDIPDDTGVVLDVQEITGKAPFSFGKNEIIQIRSNKEPLYVVLSDTVPPIGAFHMWTRDMFPVFALQLPTLEAAAADCWRTLNQCRYTEVQAIKAAINAGIVDGRSYQSCLVGLIAEIREHHEDKVRAAVGADIGNPIERWCFLIPSGGIPETNPFSAALLTWVDAWLDDHSEEYNPVIAGPAVLLAP